MAENKQRQQVNSKKQTELNGQYQHKISFGLFL
jgi:hypothetical protein